MNPGRDPLLENGERHGGFAKACTATARVAEERQRPFGIEKARSAAERRAEPLGDLTNRDALGTRDVENRRRRRAELEAAERIAVSVDSPD